MKWNPNNFKAIIAGIVILCSFAYFFIITFFEKSADPQVIIAIVGSNGSVMGYYFGASQGSNKKDELISDLSKNPVVTNSETTNINPEK